MGPDHKRFLRQSSEAYEMRQQDLIGYGHVTNFAEPLLRELMAHASLLNFKAGEFLIRSGEAGNGLYVIKSGLLKVLLPSPIQENDAIIISILGPDNFVGELSLIDNQPRSASVAAMADTELCFICQRSFQETAQHHPEIYKTLAEVLANRLRQTSDSVIATAFLTAKGRVARVMLELARVCGERGRLGVTLPDAIRQIDIAAMAGLTRETVNRVLVEWEHDEIVKRTRRRYFIADVGAFERELSEIDC